MQGLLNSHKETIALAKELYPTIPLIEAVAKMACENAETLLTELERRGKEN